MDNFEKIAFSVILNSKTSLSWAWRRSGGGVFLCEICSPTQVGGRNYTCLPLAAARSSVGEICFLRSRKSVPLSGEILVAARFAEAKTRREGNVISSAYGGYISAQRTSFQRGLVHYGTKHFMAYFIVKTASAK